MELIDRQALLDAIEKDVFASDSVKSFVRCVAKGLPTIDSVPVKFIREVIEYLTKRRDNAIHEETKTAWDEQRQTIIMLLHEWDAWNECGQTGKYGERREG